MKDTKNAETYKAVQTEVSSKPGASVSAICRAHNASYSGFRFWQRKQSSAPVEAAPKRQATLTAAQFDIHLKDLVEACAAGERNVSIKIPVTQLIERLSPEETKEFALLVAKKTTEYAAAKPVSDSYREDAVKGNDGHAN